MEVESWLLDELQRQAGRRRPVSAKCSANLEGMPDNTIDCTVAAGAETKVFTMTVTTVEGSKINYRYERSARGFRKLFGHTRCRLVTHPDRARDFVVQLDGYRVGS